MSTVIVQHWQARKALWNHTLTCFPLKTIEYFKGDQAFGSY